jgi:glycosyltransferase involved in cell wall biosynthesis
MATDSAESGAPSAVDVVICTRNREASIEAAVRGVLANEYPDFTLTVVDQSTTDATGRVLAPLVEADRRLRYVHVDEAGLSRAYNTGIEMTSADVIAFTDDDCVVPTNWIASIAAAFETEPDGDLLYGQVIPLETGDEAGLTPYFDIPQAERLSRRDGFRVCGMGANFAARRRLFDKVGGFDVVLGGGGPLRSSQDFDLAYRAYKGDSIILLRPEVTLRHDGRREAEDWPTLLVNYGTGDGAFYTKHIRSGDPMAAWYLTKGITRMTVAHCVKRVQREPSNRLYYVKGVLAGIRGSFGFKVDRAHRMYIENTKGA